MVRSTEVLRMPDPRTCRLLSIQSTIKNSFESDNTHDEDMKCVGSACQHWETRGQDGEGRCGLAGSADWTDDPMQP